jgi:hypothetical protein
MCSWPKASNQAALKIFYKIHQGYILVFMYWLITLNKHCSYLDTEHIRIELYCIIKIN